MALGLACIASLLAFGLAGWLNSWVQKQPSDNQEVNRIGSLIPAGCKNFSASRVQHIGMVRSWCDHIDYPLSSSSFWLGGIGANLQLRQLMLLVQFSLDLLAI